MKKFAALLIAVLLLVSVLPSFALGQEQVYKKDEEKKELPAEKESKRELIYKIGSGAEVSFTLHVKNSENFSVKIDDEDISGYTFENDILTLSPELLSSLEARSHYLLICSDDGNVGYVLDIIPEVVVRRQKKAAPAQEVVIEEKTKDPT